MAPKKPDAEKGGKPAKEGKSAKSGKPARRGPGAKRRRAPKRRRPREELLNYAQMGALAKRQRAEALAILTERVASPKELGEEIGRDLGAVSYHVGILRRCGLVVLDHKVPRRGAVEHFYRAVNRTLVPPNSWDNLPPAMRKGTSMDILQEFFDDAMGSIEAGIFDDPASDLSLTPFVLDDEGLDEVGERTDDYLEALLDVQANSTKRLKAKGGGKGAAEKTAATVFLASYLSARSPKDGKKASARRRR